MNIVELPVAQSCLHDGTIEAIHTAGTMRFTSSCKHITTALGKPPYSYTTIQLCTSTRSPPPPFRSRSFGP